MPELHQLHELTGQVRAPELESLALVADRRRRTTTGVISGLAASVLVAVVIVAGVAGGRDTASDPVQPAPDPAPTETFPVLTAQQIREHPDATFTSDDDFPATASDAAARIWSVCLGDCSRATEWLPGELQSAIEVSRDDFATGAVYRLGSTEFTAHAVDDWYAIEGDGPLLVDSQGHRRPLRFGSPVAITEVAGPLLYTPEGVAYLDLPARELHPLEGKGGWDWQGADDSWFWGAATLVEDSGTVSRQAALWRDAEGRFGVEVLPIGDSDGTSGMLASGTPGTMAVVEHFAQPRLAHISTDYGATWQVRRVPGGVDSGGRLPADWSSWPPG